MRIISKKKIKEFGATHPEAKAALDEWYTKTRHASWQGFEDVKKTFPQVDRYGGGYLFDIGDYRLITWLVLEFYTVYTGTILNHKEYDRDSKGWQNEC
jgi:mRNA interferase HigB